MNAEVLTVIICKECKKRHVFRGKRHTVRKYCSPECKGRYMEKYSKKYHSKYRRKYQSRLNDYMKKYKLSSKE